MEKRILEIAASSLIKMRNTSKDSNVVINEITFEVEGHRFYAEKFPNLDEFSLQTENGEVVKLAYDGTLCENNGMCLSGCGYCL
jgi:hypothetical protein